MVKHLSTSELEAGLDEISQSPSNNGLLKLIVRRPQNGQREEISEGKLDSKDGLIGDNWIDRASSRKTDGGLKSETQLTIINARLIDLIAQNKDRWQLSGDQLFIDMNLSEENLPSGTRVLIGSAGIEISSAPHTGCKKFVEWFGLDAMNFVNSPLGRKLNLRGLHAKVIKSGSIKVGDIAKII
ncbi:MAG: MOSC domain-containing protein [Candidatus Riflebacteria bacterium]|nr:MOSC domain-containing protein [Candidatus Riflebacteria bacterium]